MCKCGSLRWRDEYTLDFRAQTPQTIVASGTATIDGYTWTFSLPAGGASYVIDSTGMVSTAGGGLQLAWGPRLTLIPTLADWTPADRVRTLWSLAATPAPAGGDNATFGLAGVAGTNPSIISGLTGSAQPYSYADLGLGVTNRAYGATGVTDDTIAVETTWTSGPWGWFTRTAFPVVDADVVYSDIVAAAVATDSASPWSAVPGPIAFSFGASASYTIVGLQIQRYR